MSKLEAYLKRFGIHSATTLVEPSSTYLDRISREYGMYVLDSRAIPAMSDGLKSSQRIALWLLRSQASDVKTIALVGRMMESKMYVHGDVSAADTISYLAAPFLNNHCLIQGEGAFGTRVAPVEGIGAARYTDVKRSKFAEQHLYIDTDIIPMKENYDGSVMMPATFLPILPLVLLNGVDGIATGWATSILPRKLADIQKAVREYLQDGKITTKLTPHFERYNVQVVRSAENPKQFIIKGRLQIKNTSTVIITELPPGLTLDKFKERLIQMEEQGKVTDFTDRTTDTVNIEVKMTRESLGKHTEDSLIEFLRLRTVVTENITVQHVDGKTIRNYSNPQDLVKDFVDWRLGWYKTRYEYLLRLEEERSIFWLTMLACFETGTKQKPVAEIIATINSKAELKKLITAAAVAKDVPVIEENIEKIATLPVYKWTKEGYEETIQNLEDAHDKIEEYTAILKSEARRRAIYLKEVA